MPPAREFRRHVDIIRTRAEIIDETTLLELVTSGRRSNGTSHVLITFDDGYQNNVDDSSLELTRELGVRPLVFVVGAAVRPNFGTPRRLMRSPAGAPHPLASTESLRNAVSAGWAIGSHTATHWDCATGDAGDFEREIAGSKAALEEAIGVEVRTFAYPWGRRENISAAAGEWIVKSGYQASFTTARGRIDVAGVTSPYDLPRDPVEEWWGPREIAGCLAGGLDRVAGWR
ncbi:MAG: polysaccharide deacetylase family protein [Actinobacteria bacterium]|nr:MAG: polysaccharide deacetylase family protein [Actinomycetota bacterium]